MSCWRHELIYILRGGQSSAHAHLEAKKDSERASLNKLNFITPSLIQILLFLRIIIATHKIYCGIYYCESAPLQNNYHENDLTQYNINLLWLYYIHV